MSILSCCSLLGYSYDELYGQYIWELGVFKDIAASKDAFKTLQDNEYIRYDDLPLETHDGQPIAVEFVSNVYLVDQSKVIQCNIRDITERKRAEAERKRLMAAIEQAGRDHRHHRCPGDHPVRQPGLRADDGLQPRGGCRPESAHPQERRAGRDVLPQSVGNHLRRQDLGGPHGQQAQGRDPLHRGGDDFAGSRRFGPDRQLRGRQTGHHRASPTGGPVSAGPEDGIGGPAGRRRGPRFQQHAERDPRLCGTGPGRRWTRPSRCMPTSRRSIKAAKRSADLTRQLLAFARKQTITPKVLDLNETVEGMLKMLRRLIGEDIDLAWLPEAGPVAGQDGSRPGRPDPGQSLRQCPGRHRRRRQGHHRNGKRQSSTRPTAPIMRGLSPASMCCWP